MTALGQYLPRQRLALSVPGLTDLMGLRPSRAKIFERSDLTDLVEADDGRLAGSWPPRPTGLKARYPSPAHCPRRASRLGLARLHLSVPPYLYPHSFVRPAGNDALRGGSNASFSFSIASTTDVLIQLTTVPNDTFSRVLLLVVRFECGRGRGTSRGGEHHRAD